MNSTSQAFQTLLVPPHTRHLMNLRSRLTLSVSLSHESRAGSVDHVPRLPIVHKPPTTSSFYPLRSSWNHVYTPPLAVHPKPRYSRQLVSRSRVCPCRGSPP